LGDSAEEKEVKDRLNLIMQMTIQVIRTTIKMIKVKETPNRLMVTPAVEEEEAAALEAIDRDTLEEVASELKSL